MTGTPALAVLVLALGLSACSDSGSVATPSAASAVPQPAPPPNNAIGIQGTVVDTADRRLAGATVEVVGDQAGTSVTTDATGQFSLTGTFDDTTLFRATKAGHVTGTQPWRRIPGYDRPFLLFYLAVLEPPANIAGDYTLTFVADPTCAANLPGELRTRTYTATISTEPSPNVPANTRFTVVPSGAPFFSYFNWFSVGVAGDYLAFWLGDEHLVEQIATHTYLEIRGEATATVPTRNVSTISASFDGVFDYCELKSEMGSAEYRCSPTPVAQARCASKNHQLILARR